MSDAKGEFVVHRSGAPQDGGEGFNWTLPILALIVASGLGYYMTRGGEDDPQSATPRPAVTTIAEVPSSQLFPNLRVQRYSSQPGHFAFEHSGDWKVTKEVTKPDEVAVILSRNKRDRMVLAMRPLAPWEEVDDRPQKIKGEWVAGDHAQAPNFGLDLRFPGQRWACYRDRWSIELHLLVGRREYVLIWPMALRKKAALVANTFQVIAEPTWAEEQRARLGLSEAEAKETASRELRDEIVQLVTKLPKLSPRNSAGLAALEKGKLDRLGATWLKDRLEEELRLQPPPLLRRQ